MSKLMRCPYCGLSQDEPKGVKTCSRCGGGLEFEHLNNGQIASYVQVQMELDQVAAPTGRNVERYLLVTIRTPGQVPQEEAAPAGKKRPPLNFASVMDISGSMQGQKIMQAKEAVRQSLSCLHPEDAFSLVTFSSEVLCPFPPGRVDSNTAEIVEVALQKIQATGMTALCGGLEMGIKIATKYKKDSNLLMLLSDGQANVGETNLEKIGQRALKAHQKGLTVSSLGIGMDYNEALMTEIATQGGGRFYHVENANKIPAFVAGELGEAAHLAARETEIHLAIPEGATLIPLSAAYRVQQNGGQAIVSVGDIPCDTELEIPLRLALLAQKAGTKLSMDGTLGFNSPAGHAISIPINRVTVRFVEQTTFQLREGMVLPVAERVFTQLKAASVLGVTRARAVQPATAEKQLHTVLDNLRAYAELLGEGRAAQEIDNARERFDLYASSPAAAKQAVSDAYRSQRSSKDFNKKQ
jgi:Ca-activated chloride channel family protein